MFKADQDMVELFDYVQYRLQIQTYIRSLDKDKENTGIKPKPVDQPWSIIVARH